MPVLNIENFIISAKSTIACKSKVFENSKLVNKPNKRKLASTLLSPETHLLEIVVDLNLI